MADEKEKIHESDLLRTEDNMMKHDVRWEFLSSWGLSTVPREPIPLEEYRKTFADIALSDDVPRRIRVRFEVAKNLGLYSWFVYGFIPVAELVAFVTVEDALQEYFGKKWGFRKLLSEAKKQGLIKNEGFTEYKRNDEIGRRQHEEMQEILKLQGVEDYPPYKPSDFVDTLIETFPRLRNSLAHGRIGVRPWRLNRLVICSEILNQVYANKPD